MSVSSDTPIFVLGVDRSGTTLLSLMLSAHSRIAIPYESHFFVEFYRKRESFGDLHIPENRANLVNLILDRPFVRRWDRPVRIEEVDLDKCQTLPDTIKQVYLAYADKFGKDIWGDKTPAYTHEMDTLNAMFPLARFIHIMRDGRDVALSLVKQSWGPEDFMMALRYWAKTITLARKMLRMLPRERYRELRYEDLVARPEAELKGITDFLGIEYEPQMPTSYVDRAHAVIGEAVNTYHKHLTQPPLTSLAFKWRKNLSAVDQAIAYELAGAVLTELGYPAGTKAHPLKVPRKGYYRLLEAYRWRSGRVKKILRKAWSGPASVRQPSSGRTHIGD